MNLDDQTPAAASVENLREQLRALGYLDARVNRFVLGTAVTRQSAGAVAAAASLRIGALAGVLLGPAAAVGIVARAPELVTRPMDAAVLAGYLSVCFAIAAAIATWLVVLPASYAARRSAGRPNFAQRAQRITASAGIIAGLACLAYLMLWWRAVAFTNGSSPLVTAAAAGVAVAVSWLLGRVVGVTALAVIARSGLADALRPRRASSSWALTVFSAIVAIGGTTALLVATAPRDTNTIAPPPLTVISTNQRVIVIAIDGLDVATLDRLGGRTPALLDLAGRPRATLAPDADRDPARLWTTIATGAPPERHGVGALEGRELAGVAGRLSARTGILATIGAATDLIRLTRPAIASGTERRLPAFWEVAARAGLRTAVIHWWATWPADAAGGIVLSDRALLRLEHGGALDGEIAPAKLYDTLRDSWPKYRGSVRQEAGAIRLLGSPDVNAILDRSADLDSAIMGVAIDPDLGPLDLLTIYLPGLDIAQHTLFANAATLSPAEISERIAALDHYYEMLDRIVNRVAYVPTEGLNPPNPYPNTTVILVTQGGRVSQPSPGIVTVYAGVVHDRVEPGRLRDALADATPVTNASRMSVAGTVLYALGVPVADDLGSPPLLSLFGPAFVAAHPLRTVATYGTRSSMARRAGGNTLDQEMIDRMRSLGYLK